MKKSFIKRLAALALVIVSVFSISAVAMAETGLSVGSTAYTIKGDVAVRSSAGVQNNNIISRVDTGTAVTILQTTYTTNGWYRVRVDGLTSNGYIREDCLGTTAPQTPSTGTQNPIRPTLHPTKPKRRGCRGDLHGSPGKLLSTRWLDRYKKVSLHNELGRYHPERDGCSARTALLYHSFSSV